MKRIIGLLLGVASALSALTACTQPPLQETPLAAYTRIASAGTEGKPFDFSALDTFTMRQSVTYRPQRPPSSDGWPAEESQTYWFDRRDTQDVKTKLVRRQLTAVGEDGAPQYGDETRVFIHNRAATVLPGTLSSYVQYDSYHHYFTNNDGQYPYLPYDNTLQRELRLPDAALLGEISGQEDVLAASVPQAHLLAFYEWTTRFFAFACFHDYDDQTDTPASHYRFLHPDDVTRATLTVKRADTLEWIEVTLVGPSYAVPQEMGELTVTMQASCSTEPFAASTVTAPPWAEPVEL